MRHDKACAELQCNILNEIGVKSNNEHWYAQVLKLVVTNHNKCKPTEPHKPDAIIHNNENGTCMLIDVEISRGRNMVKKQAQKILKYEYFTIKVQCMWKVSIRVIC